MFWYLQKNDKLSAQRALITKVGFIYLITFRALEGS